MYIYIYIDHILMIFTVVSMRFIDLRYPHGIPWISLSLQFPEVNLLGTVNSVRPGSTAVASARKVCVGYV